MPIRPENRDRYPDDWAELSRAIRFDRAGGRCECEGECRMPAHLRVGGSPRGRCENYHGAPSVYTGSRVVLTVAHLDHTPENSDPANLRAMCQGCHLWYDREHHAETAAATRQAARAAAGQTPLDIPEPT